MRHIPLKEKPPCQAWLDEAADLLEQLKAAPDSKSRNAIIDENSNLWRDLKSWLLELSHGKCWFSEAKDCFSHWDVEHYRPKKEAKDADGTVHEGYWWLSFDWTNLRICGNAGNRKKGTFFPLRTGCARCGVGGDLRLEDPKLLDPADEDDPDLLAFNLEGRAIPAAHVADEWERERVRYSVKRCNLDFPPLMEKRKAVWAECWDRIQQYRSELQVYSADKTNSVARAGMKSAASSIRRMVGEREEFSSVARACVLSSGDARVIAILQSA